MKERGRGDASARYRNEMPRLGIVNGNVVQGISDIIRFIRSTASNLRRRARQQLLITKVINAHYLSDSEWLRATILVELSPTSGETGAGTDFKVMAENSREENWPRWMGHLRTKLVFVLPKFLCLYFTCEQRVPAVFHF